MNNNLLALLGKLVLRKVEKLGTGDDYAHADDFAPADVHEANIVSSLRADQMGREKEHALLLDIDVPAYLIPSSTPGHSHLYVDVRMREHTLKKVLDALYEAGVIERGYAAVSHERGATSLRLPWIKKAPEPKLDGMIW